MKIKTPFQQWSSDLMSIFVFESKPVPRKWKSMPEWLKNNEWLIKNQDHQFARSLWNLIFSLEGYKKIHRPVSYKVYLYCNNPNAELKMQYVNLYLSLEEFNGRDLFQAHGLIIKFQTDYKDYLNCLVIKLQTHHEDSLHSICSN